MHYTAVCRYPLLDRAVCHMYSGALLTTASASSTADRWRRSHYRRELDHADLCHSTEPVLNRQGMASTAAMIILALNKYLLKEA